MRARLELLALDGIGEVAPGDDLALHIARAIEHADLALTDGDVLVVTQKVVSKAEGRLVELSTVEPSEFARGWAERWGKDPRQVELVLRESAEIVQLWDTLCRNRRAGAEMAVRKVRETGSLRDGLTVERAVDSVWIFNDPALYHSLVLDRGWPRPTTAVGSPSG